MAFGVVDVHAFAAERERAVRTAIEMRVAEGLSAKMAELAGGGFTDRTLGGEALDQRREIGSQSAVEGVWIRVRVRRRIYDRGGGGWRRGNRLLVRTRLGF